MAVILVDGEDWWEEKGGKNGKRYALLTPEQMWGTFDA